jgi:hypothetical protein
MASIRQYQNYVSPVGHAAVAGDTIAATNANAVATYAAAPGQAHVVGGVQWSYSAAPAGGRLKIEDGAGNIIFDLDITAAGPGSIQFPFGRAGAIGTAMIVTLFAAGAGVVGKANVDHWVQSA